MSTVTKTIGATSRDYLTMASWAAALDDTGIYSLNDDAVGECYNDLPFDEFVDIDGGGTVGLGSITLTVADGERHDGTAGTGVVNACSSLSGYSPSTFDVGVNNVAIEWIEVEAEKTTSGGSVSGVHIASGISGTALRNCIIHDMDTSSGSATGSAITSDSTATDMLNCIGYNSDSTNGGSLGSFWSSSSGFSHEVYNSTAYGFGSYGINQGSGTLTAKNCIAMGNGTADFNSLDIVAYCMSSDGTADDIGGTGNLVNKAAVDQFRSTVVGSEDFHLKSGADAIDAGTDLGTTPTGVEIDIDGRDRDAQDDVWNIGADQYVSPTRSIGATSRDYLTITAWEADLDDPTSYLSGDDAVGECYNDAPFTDAVAIDGGGTVGLNSRTLTVADGEQHDGTAGTGVRLTSTGRTAVSIANATTTTLSLIEIDGSSFTSNYYEVVRGMGNLALTATIERLIVHGYTGTEIWKCIGLGTPRRGIANILNNVVYNLHQPKLTYRISAISMGDGYETNKFLNNTVHNITATDATATGTVNGVYATDDSDNILQNNCIGDLSTAGTATSACFSVSSYSAATSDHNLSSDATASGTGSLTNKAAADQFVSTVSGSEDFHLKVGADAIDAGTDLGTTPTGVEIDIDGHDRDLADNIWSIGAHQYLKMVVFFNLCGNILLGQS